MTAPRGRQAAVRRAACAAPDVGAVVRRVLLALASSLVLAFAAAPTAHALPVLAEGDAVELAGALTDATAAQGVCYGWAVDLTDGSGGPSGTDVGSDRGPGQAVDRAGCERFVELQGAIEYTCESCEGDDVSAITVAANFDGAPDTGDLEELGFSGADLTNDDNDVVLINMVGALPLIVASAGEAPPVPGADPAQAAQPAAGDGPTGTPSTPDWLRENWLALVCFLLLTAGGGLWLTRILLDDRRQRRDEAPPPTSTPTEA